jgi:hypothetical protein
MTREGETEPAALLGPHSPGDRSDGSAIRLCRKPGHSPQLWIVADVSSCGLWMWHARTQLVAIAANHWPCFIPGPEAQGGYA